MKSLWTWSAPNVGCSWRGRRHSDGSHEFCGKLARIKIAETRESKPARYACLTHARERVEPAGDAATLRELSR